MEGGARSCLKVTFSYPEASPRPLDPLTLRHDFPVRQVWILWGGVIVTVALTLPAAVACACFLARRRASRGRPLPVRTAVADVGAVAGTAPRLWMTLTPRPAPNTVDLVPFDDLLTLFQHSAETVFAQLGGNLLVFAALGAALPVRWARLARLGRVAGWPRAPRSPSSSSSTACAWAG